MTDSDTQPLAPGDRCGRYTIERVLGRGGMGVVYLVKDEAGRRRALKTLVFGGKLKETVVDRFKREILLLASIEHVHVVRFYEAGRLERPDGTTMWLSLEFLEGQTLREVIDARPDGVEPENVARWGRHIADGVGAAHRIHVVHRDLKPENAALSGDIVKVFDLGIAKWRGAMNATAANLRIGTLAYMAPEQVDPSLGEVNERTDIYALGLIMYEMATGKHPLVPLHDPIPPHEAQMRLVMADVKRIVEVRPQFPLDLEAIILRCLHRDASDRFPSMRDLSDALEDVLLRLRTERHAASFADLGVGASGAPADIVRKAKMGSGSDVTPPPVVQSAALGGSSSSVGGTVRMSVEDVLSGEVGPERAKAMIAAAHRAPGPAGAGATPATPVPAAAAAAAPTTTTGAVAGLPPSRGLRGAGVAAMVALATVLGVGVVVVRKQLTAPAAEATDEPVDGRPAAAEEPAPSPEARDEAGAATETTPDGAATPPDDASGDDAAGGETAGDDAPGDDAPGDDAPGDDAPGAAGSASAPVPSAPSPPTPRAPVKSWPPRPRPKGPSDLFLNGGDKKK